MLKEATENHIRIFVNNQQHAMLKAAGSPITIEEKIQAINVIEAISSQGYSIVERYEIPSEIYGAEAVGYLDKITKTVYVKSGISQARKNFTLAHELGHILMHKDMDVMHRQVARKKGHPRDTKEQEADYFASCWLMPRLLVIKQFKERFIYAPLVFTDNIAYLLTRNNIKDQQDLLEATQESGFRELALAKANTFNFKNFASLSNYFDVSPDAMAIRLQELELVDY